MKSPMSMGMKISKTLSKAKEPINSIKMHLNLPFPRLKSATVMILMRMRNLIATNKADVQKSLKSPKQKPNSRKRMKQSNLNPLKSMRLRRQALRRKMRRNKLKNHPLQNLQAHLNLLSIKRRTIT